MKSEFIHNDSNSRLILIFAGWSTGPDLFRHIRRQGWDTLVVYDFSDFSFDNNLLEGYDTVWLVAWSLGVCAAELLLEPSLISSAIAVNGSLQPVDDEFGIPAGVYKGTAASLDLRNLIKFRKRMAGDSAVYKTLFSSESDAEEIESLRKQLYVIKYKTENFDSDRIRLPWKRVFISENDRIFPAENLRRSWERMNIELITLKDGNHYVDLENVIDTFLPDPTKVGQRFANAVQTYEASACAQRQIASCLCNLIPAGEYKKMLEVGSGSGLLSRMIGRAFSPHKVDFVDLAPSMGIGIAPEERYFAADAEEWIKDCGEKYDLIVSSSTFQWFANLPLFLKNCREHLKPDEGVLAFSTFLPGNLGELDALRPSPIIYTGLDKIKEYLSALFRSVEISHEDITVGFDSPRELLLHLKKTGVSGSAPSRSLNLSRFKSINKLTYRPVYCVCKI